MDAKYFAAMELLGPARGNAPPDSEDRARWDARIGLVHELFEMPEASTVEDVIAKLAPARAFVELQRPEELDGLSGPERVGFLLYGIFWHSANGYGPIYPWQIAAAAGNP